MVQVHSKFTILIWVYGSASLFRLFLSFSLDGRTWFYVKETVIGLSMPLFAPKPSIVWLCWVSRRFSFRWLQGGGCEIEPTFLSLDEATKSHRRYRFASGALLWQNTPVGTYINHVSSASPTLNPHWSATRRKQIPFDAVPAWIDAEKQLRIADWNLDCAARTTK